MKRKQSFLTYLLVMINVTVLVFLFAKNYVMDWVKNVVYGTGTAEYFQLSSGYDDQLLALGRQNDTYVLSQGGTHGSREWSARLDPDGLPDSFVIDRIQILTSDEFLISAYQLNEEGLPENLQLYLAENRGAKLSTLLNTACTGNTESERKNSVRFSAFALYDGIAQFFLWKNDQLDRYSFDVDNLVLSKNGTFTCRNYRDSLMLQNGTIAVGQTNGVLTIYSTYGERLARTQFSGTISRLYQGDGEAIYYLDAANGVVNEIRVNENGEYYQFQQRPVDATYPLTVQNDGNLIWVNNGILYRYDNGPVQINGVLYRSRVISVLLLLLVLILILWVSSMLSRFLYGLGGQKSSMLSREIIMSLTLFVTTVGLGSFVINHSVRNWEEEQIEWTVSSDMRTAVEMIANSDMEDVLKMFNTLTIFSKDELRAEEATLYRFADGGYEVVGTFEPALETGVISKGNNELLRSQAHAFDAWVVGGLNGARCVAVTSSNGYVLLSHTNVEEQMKSVAQKVREIEIFLAAVVLIYIFFTLHSVRNIHGAVNRLKLGMKMVGEGNFNVEVGKSSNDELGELAMTFNGMMNSIREAQSQERELSKSYSRFVPQSILDIWGVERLSQVHLKTTTEQDMVVMSIFFEVPNDGDKSEYFLCGDTMIEKTTVSVTAYGGKTFNHWQSGYVALFDADKMEDAVRAAISIQKTTQGYNKEREIKHRKPVRTYVAIDYGDVYVGVTGDEDHMVPIVLSMCMSYNDQMLDICHTLDAGILCSENVIDGLREKSNRYVGKCQNGETVFRVYEVTDGSPFLQARGKSDTKELFDRAVLNFYSREFAVAKRQFLELAKTGGKDGAVWYYLNASDRYESSPAPEELLLDKRGV